MGGYMFNPVYYDNIAKNLDLMVEYIQSKDLIELIELTNYIDLNNVVRNSRALYKKLNINPLSLNLK
jgi:hypothetical protein